MKKIYWLIVVVALILLLLGTFFDIQIAQALFTPTSAFAQFFAAAAMVPIWFLVPIATGLMLGFLITQFQSLHLMWRVICLGLLLFGVYMSCERMYEMVGSRHLNGLPYNTLLWMTILLFMGATAIGATASKKYPQAVFLAAFVGLTAVAGSRFVLDHSKSLWGRQRFQTMDDPLTQFTAWYQPQFPSLQRQQLMGDSIKSFPSGHSMGSISLLYLSLFPALFACTRKHLSTWVNAVSIFALVFWGFTMVARMLLGEHFLSDVSMSGIIFLLFFMCFTAVGTRWHPTLKEEANHVE